MGIGLSIGLVVEGITDLLYDLALAGIAAVTYIAGSVGSLAFSAATLALDVGATVVPYGLAILPYIVTYAPALALSYFVYTNPILTASFLFAALATGAGAVAAIALATTEPTDIGPTAPTNGLKSNEEVQRELDEVIEFIDEKQKYRAELESGLEVYNPADADSRFVSITGEIVDNNLVNRGLDFILNILKKKEEIQEAAGELLEKGSNLIEKGSEWIRGVRKRLEATNPRTFTFTFKDLDQRAVGVTFDDFLYGLAECHQKKGCPKLTTTRKRKNVSVQSKRRRNTAKRKVRVSSRSRKRTSVRPAVRKSGRKATSKSGGSNRLRQTSKRRRVGKQKKTMRRK